MSVANITKFRIRENEKKVPKSSRLAIKYQKVQGWPKISKVSRLAKVMLSFRASKWYLKVQYWQKVLGWETVPKGPRLAKCTKRSNVSKRYLREARQEKNNLLIFEHCPKEGGGDPTRIQIF